MTKIKFGTLVKDKITGFKGIITGRRKYINGCMQYYVTPSVNKKGEMQEAQWIDKDQLELLGYNQELDSEWKKEDAETECS